MLTGDRHGARARARAFDWFLGQNQLQQPLYDATTGGAATGCTPIVLNENQGAESTLSFLLALLEMRAAAEADDPASMRTMPHDASLHGYETLFHRHATNPILTAADWPYPAHTVFNPGATRLPDGHDAAPLPGRGPPRPSHLCAARSANGVDGWVIDPEPTLRPDPERYPEELWGIEDPRITFVEELGKYAVAYTAFGRGGPGVALALTEDFRSFERFGLVMQPDDKDAALLPRRIDGIFALIHRPDRRLGRARLDLVLARPAELGQATS